MTQTQWWVWSKIIHGDPWLTWSWWEYSIARTLHYSEDKNNYFINYPQNVITMWVMRKSMWITEKKQVRAPILLRHKQTDEAQGMTWIVNHDYHRFGGSLVIVWQNHQDCHVCHLPEDNISRNTNYEQMLFSETKTLIRLKRGHQFVTHDCQGLSGSIGSVWHLSWCQKYTSHKSLCFSSLQYKHACDTEAKPCMSTDLMYVCQQTW